MVGVVLMCGPVLVSLFMGGDIFFLSPKYEIALSFPILLVTFKMPQKLTYVV